jgi:hypothetical protein
MKDYAKIEKISDQLEIMVDDNGLINVVEALALMCSVKADHILENWQDDNLSAQWDRAAAIMLRSRVAIEEKQLLV